MADEIDSDSSPHGDNADPKASENGFRQVWRKIPPAVRTLVPLVLLVALVVVGFYNWVRPPRGDWSHLPGRLVCQVQSGTRPPPAVKVASVAVTHPRATVLQLVVRFSRPLPASPGYRLTYQLANNGTPFAVLDQQQGRDELLIRDVRNTGDYVREDLGTHAHLTAPDVVEMTLNLTQFGIQREFVNPALTVASALDAPPVEPVTYALQICHG
ncbi:hypothetical protein AWC29_14660 [Mycobacterium triplex]|uniref:Uncharacterized protein n=1 Tax=Mycobacterium triplex TaxID=47839 RepID=A0A024K663_9MYCO|nr:hypothetical protein [Mycobacterium triplex]ORX04284.1 hypothetical protein AWC29_14660 [Mycobacterium triplex]CDO91003.1 hypothetical protein BN973_05409 [Mycobacterium triplex]